VLGDAFDHCGEGMAAEYAGPHEIFDLADKLGR
jgi:hypothetical protein